MKRKETSHKVGKDNSKRKRAGKSTNSEMQETKEDKEDKALSAEKSRRRRFELLGIFLVLTAVLCAFGIFGVNAGFVGAYFSATLTYLFGAGALLFTAILLLTGLYFITEHRSFKLNARFLGFILMFAMLLTLYHYVRIPAESEILPESISVGGGFLGGGLLLILRKFFGEIVCGVVIFAGLVASVILTTDFSLGKGLSNTKEKAAEGFGAGFLALLSLKNKIKDHIENTNQKNKLEDNEEANFKEADLYNQEWDDEYLLQRTEKTDIVDKPFEPVESVEEEEKPQKPKLHSFWQDLEREKELARVIKEARVSATQNKEFAEETESKEDFIDDTDFMSGNNEESEDESVNVKETPKIPPKAEQSVSVVPPSERRDSGMGEGGFEVRADAFKSRETILDYPASDDNDELDLSTPDFKESDEADISQIPQQPEINTIGGNNFMQENNPETIQTARVEKPYELPEVTHILSKSAKKENLALKIEIDENARILSKTLSDFKVNANIIDACHGPAVTRYELEPAPGVKVSKITGLADDIALALAATSVRIEPIPGKSAIGIEVPNKELEDVQLREVLERPYFKEAESKLTVGLGMDIGGQAIFADLAKMPHLLIAGSTGSGKSVCVNTLITSILFKAKPDEVKFILIDPKMVELSNYNGIPHLMTPVVTDAKKAASVLNWAVQEMEKRYTKFAQKVVRNMESYNTKFPEDKMCAIVIIIDELADLMMVAPHDVEDAICRLAQKARAAGIHLVLATQRPSVDVITGIIKANIPSRIAFAVSSQIDSRTILDSSGAEKLLGRGDMLFYPIGSPKPRRVQGAFVSDEEVELLLDFIKGQGVNQDINEEIESFTAQDILIDDKGKSKRDDSTKADELLLDAVELVVSTGQASASNVQRRFRVGYARAGRLIDTMETLGIVGPSLGSKPREILMSAEDAIKAVESIL